jgi:hypothetical protein
MLSHGFFVPSSMNVYDVDMIHYACTMQYFFPVNSHSLSLLFFFLELKSYLISCLFAPTFIPRCPF